MDTNTGRIEFMDLWHGLKLPDDVELRRELAKGLSLSISSEFSSDTVRRGLAADRGGSSPRAGSDEEEGQAGRGTSSTPSPPHQYTLG